MCLCFASRVQRCTVCGCLEASCPGEKQWFRQSGVSASFPDLKRIEFLYVRLITSHVFLLVCFVFCFLAVWHISLVESVHIQINNVLLILGLLICVSCVWLLIFFFHFFPSSFLHCTEMIQGINCVTMTSLFLTTKPQAWGFYSLSLPKKIA